MREGNIISHFTPGGVELKGGTPIHLTGRVPHLVKEGYLHLAEGGYPLHPDGGYPHPFETFGSQSGLDGAPPAHPLGDSTA